MKKNYKNLWAMLLAIACITLSTNNVQAGTFDRVHSILETKCASCHSGATPAGALDLSGDEALVYENLINATPSNAAAATRGDKLVDPGYPYRSYLLRKANNGLIHEADGGVMASGEGDLMPPYGGGEALTNIELEVIRQWIQYGASETATLPDNIEDLIEDYYTNGGYEPVPRPAPPAAGKGFQIHMGPIFIAPGDEKEFLQKYNPRFEGDTEVTRLDVTMNETSHHYIHYKFDTPADAAAADIGLREVGFGADLPFGGGSDFVTAWADSDNFRLPGGTAYFWDESTVFDLNYHIPNYSDELILAADLYMNVYTQEAGTAIKEMKGNLTNNLLLFITAGNEADFEDDMNNGQQWNLWQISSHTHQLGTDFDIFNKATGEQIYEGFYDYSGCNCNVGYYDWEHAPIKEFQPYYQLMPGEGLRYTAEYNNTTSNLITFGLTTNDEMMLFVVQYTEGEAIPFVLLDSESDQFCASQTAAELTVMPDGGVLSGPGIEGGIFNPSLAGVGLHTLEYTFDGITSYYDVNVTAGGDTFEVTNNNNTLAAPAGYDNYQWYNNGQPITNATGAVYVVTSGGNYTVVVNINGCEVESEVFSFSTGMSETAFNKAGFSVYPNPFSKATSVNYTLEQTAKVSIEVYNMLGQQVLKTNETTQHAGEQNYTINADLDSGVYFIKVAIDGKMYSQKMVKE